ncbi:MULTISPECIES: hypothetical protein [unclassified Frankia]|uniref:hypothetical protein n=1 Tax=unclassified Frankia TaxID=2632575 RepID=UPI001EE4CC4D|nr:MULTISPECIES: hypothetical protein [unclassified Frankia]
MSMVVGLTFLFGLGNVWLLALRLGVPGYVAPLVAPAVDLSVLGLLVAIRELAVRGAPVREVRAARRLLLFASLVTLALNVAEPALAGNPGKAAFDAVGPLLLIGWGEVGPGLPGVMAEPRPTRPATVTPDPTATSETDGDKRAVPRVAQEKIVLEGAVAASTVNGTLNEGDADLSGPSRSQTGEGAQEQDLFHRARAEDVLHWQQHHRPISAETLGKRLHVGSRKARKLVTHLRSDTHGTLDSQAPRPATQVRPSTA